jgi:hypothetical protein
MTWTAGAVFLAAFFVIQFAFGLAIFLRRGRTEWAIVLAAIFILNSGTAINSLLTTLGVSEWGSTNLGIRVYNYLDRAIILLIGYLALAYPNRPRWAARPWILPSLFLGLFLTVAIPFALQWPTFDGSKQVADDGACLDCWTPFYAWAFHVLNVGFVVLLLRWAFLLPKIRSPIETTHFAFLFAAFAVRGVHVEWLVYSGYLTAQPNEWFLIPPWEHFATISMWRGLVGLATPLVAVYLLLRVRGKVPSDQRKAIDIVFAFMVVGAIEAFIATKTNPFTTPAYKHYAFGIVVNLDVLVLRPALIGYAMLRYDFLGSWANRRPAILGVVGGIASIGFAAGIHSTILPTTSLAWLPLAIGIPTGISLGLAATMLLYTYVGPPRNTAAARYLALLEDAYRNAIPSAQALERLDRDRRRLGLDESEGQALQAAVASRWASAGKTWLPGQRVVGRYQLTRILGGGGWGEVYLADDVIDGRPIVLKRTRRLGPEQQKALLTEAYTLSKVSHPHLVPLVRSEMVDGEPILVLEYMPGGNLATRLLRGPLSKEEIHKLATGLLAALASVHGAKIVHGDVKPSNLLFNANGDVCLADFGLARQETPAPTLGDPTPSVLLGGSLRYLAPEQVLGQPVSQASDMYSAGIVLLEALTGEHPIPSDVPDYEQRRRIAEGEIRVPASAKAWRLLLNRLLERNPSQRPSAEHAQAMIPEA